MKRSFIVVFCFFIQLSGPAWAFAGCLWHAHESASEPHIYAAAESARTSTPDQDGLSPRIHCPEVLFEIVFAAPVHSIKKPKPDGENNRLSLRVTLSVERTSILFSSYLGEGGGGLQPHVRFNRVSPHSFLSIFLI